MGKSKKQFGDVKMTVSYWDLDNLEANYDCITGGANDVKSLSSVRSRHHFVRRVYTLVSVQLAVITVLVAFAKFMPIVDRLLADKPWLIWWSFAATLVTLALLLCAGESIVSVSYPLNLTLLIAFTLLESLLLACIGNQYETDTLLITTGLTSLVVVSVTLFACQNRVDFNGPGNLSPSFLFANLCRYQLTTKSECVVFMREFKSIVIYLFIVTVVLAAGILGSMLYVEYTESILRASIATSMFSCYLVLDTQLMLANYI